MSGTVTNLTIGLNANRDLYLDSTNNLAILTGVQALLQSCQARVEAQLREMLYAFNQGMPTMDTVFRQQRIAQFVAAGRARIGSVVGVVQVKSFVVKIQGGVLTYTATILTQYSPKIMTVTNQGV